jgi:hypothetical protein
LTFTLGPNAIGIDSNFSRRPIEGTMSESSSRAPLLTWLKEDLKRGKLAPPLSSLEELADAAERLVRLYLQQRLPLRRAAVAKKLATLSRNLERAAKAAAELGEQGMTQVLLASQANSPPETAEPIKIIANLRDWALWSTRAAETAQLMSLSDQDHKGGRTPDVRLRSLVVILMDRYEFLLGVRATHTVDPDGGLGHSTFDLFVKEAIRLYAPEGAHFEPRLIDDAIDRALESRASNFWGEPVAD